jgi:anti-anti-sigma factor
MQFQHLKLLARGNATVIAIAKSTLAEINEENYSTSPVAELLDEFARAISATPGAVIIDLRDTHFLDSAGMSVVFRLARLLAERNQPRLICCSPGVQDVLVVCRLTSICPCVTELEEAVARLAEVRSV